ncbi:MAG: RDD family protein [Acidimicrobiales bacterium]
MNPYRVVDPTDVLWKRIGAWAVDATLGTVVLVVVALLVRALLGTAVGLLAGVVAAMAFWFTLHTLVQGARGATPGKALAGLRVVDADGRPCTTAAAWKRTLCWFADGFPYLLPVTGFTAAMSSKGNQRLGDRVARTWVVDQQYLGVPPFAVALPKDPGAGFAPYRLETMGDYLPPSVDILALKQMRDAAPAAPALTAAPTTVDPVRDHEPRWDPERQAYVRWNGLLQEWVVFDEDQREWVRAH